jgi:DNA polymerase-4
MRKIIHIDLDYFFAQVELLDKPHLAHKPVAIGGLYEGRGVISTSNYVARKFGVKSAMPTKIALQKCPELVLLDSNFDKYRKLSHIFFEVLHGFSDKVQKVSIDEAYLDVTENKDFNCNAVKLAREIKKEVLKKTGLTASIGLSYNKFLAKFASELYKPNGLAIIREEDIIKNLAPFSVDKILGVGKVTQKKMQDFGISKFGDLQGFTKLDLVNMFGSFGASLYNYCRGIDNRLVHSSRIRKSLSVEKTFAQDKDNFDELTLELHSQFEELKGRLSKISSGIKTIFVKIKYSHFESTTIESAGDLEFEKFRDLFVQRFDTSKKVRLIGLGVKFYYPKVENQLELLSHL